MKFLIIVIIAVVVIAKIFENKLVIRFDTLFRKGFPIIKDKYGVYCYTRKARRW